MNNENKLNSELGEWLRKKEPAWEIIKHCDRFTIGVPDFSVSRDITTAWFEVKILKQDKDLLRPRDWADNLVQLERLLRIEGFYYVYNPYADQSLIIDAWVVKCTIVKNTRLAEEYPVPGKNWEGLHQRLSSLIGGDDVQRSVRHGKGI